MLNLMFKKVQGPETSWKAQTEPKLYIVWKFESLNTWLKQMSLEINTPAIVIIIMTHYDTNSD